MGETQNQRGMENSRGTEFKLECVHFNCNCSVVSGFAFALRKYHSCLLCF